MGQAPSDDPYLSDEERAAAAKTLGGHLDVLGAALREAFTPVGAALDAVLRKLLRTC